MNTVKITEKQQEVCKIITVMNQVILFLVILESFKYKTSITGNTYNVDEKITNDDGNEVNNPKYDASKVGKNETEVALPLKHLSNFWRSLNMPLSNCEVELILTWSENCVLADMTVNATVNLAIVAPLELEFQITDTKLYVSVVTLSKENDKKTFRTIKNRI